MKNKQLVRKQNDRMVFGVAAGLADYIGVDPVIIRLLFVLLTLAGAHGILIYLILLIIMPEEDAPVAKAQPFDEEEIVIKGM
ncbi:MAG: PspC domain-containing protein [Chloroflexi bacterium]|nr:PspC domain-containing protein [Chloroflexota bacterium]